MWPAFGKLTISTHQLKSTFCLHYPEHQVLDHRWPGLLSQTAFCQCSLTTRMYFSALRNIDRTTWGTVLLLTAILAHPFAGYIWIFVSIVYSYKVSKLLVLHEPDAQRNECQKHCLLCNDCEVTSMLGIYHVLCCMLPIIYIGHRFCCDHCYTCVDLPEQYGCCDQYGTLIVNVNSCQWLWLYQ